MHELADIDDTLLALLRKVDTPTVCNAIEVVQGRRGFDRFTRGTMLSSAPHEPAIVGRAVTAQIAALAPSTEAPDITRARRMAYYKAMHDAPKPAIAVIEDLDFPHCIGAYWGEVNTTIHKAFGLSGALTNGVMRDLGDMPAGFPVIAGSVGPSHGFVHVRSIAAPVTVFGLCVEQGDFIHADRHGAVVIPEDAIPGLAAAILKLQSTERLILDPARAPGFDFDAFEKAWAEFEKART
jgi:regulator of RNase E activity RraA